jgi:hypothetical protein
MMMVRRNTLLCVTMVSLAIAFAFVSGFSLLGQSRDYLSYELFFNNLQPNNPSELIRFEPGFVLLAVISKFILMLQLPAFVFTILSLALILKARVFERTYYPVLTMMFYLANWYPLHEYTQLRVAIATSLLFFAFDQFFSGSKFRSGMFFILAASFHGSALFAVALVGFAYFISNFRLIFSVPAIAAAGFVAPLLITGILFPIVQMMNPLSTSYILTSDDYVAPNILSGANILTTLFLCLFAVGTGLKQQRHRVIFLTAIASISVFIAFRDNPVFAQRLKEIGLVFMTLIVFDYKITWNTIPQTAVAVVLAVWSLYSAITQGIILEGLL